MLGKKNGQIDVFNGMIYEKLIPKDHFLIMVDEVINFSFVYEIVRDKYSNVGRKSFDPVILFKMLLLEFLYRLSDGEVVSRTTTDVAFRWFLGLNIDDEVPDDTTLSHFRIHRLGNEGLESIFNEIVKECIKKNLVKKRRYQVDSTDVAANVNYPSIKKIICTAFRKVTKEMSKFNSNLAKEFLENFENEIQLEHDSSEHVSLLKYCEIGKKYAELMYVRTYNEFQDNERYVDAYSILWDLVQQYSDPNSKDRIISCVDPDARVAHKSPGNRKRGYKDHILIDEDSEIILASSQTPFNIKDELEFIGLVDKVNENFGLKPEEISADKAYGTNYNRKHLMDKEIVSNIGFYDRSEIEFKRFIARDFKISDDLKCAECPNGSVCNNGTLREKSEKIAFRFNDVICSRCSFRDQCLNEKELSKNKGRVLEISTKHDAVLRDIHRSETEEFEIAINKRYIVERRFATLVRKHGLRRCRYLRLKGAKNHIILANIASNIVRMVNLLIDKNHPRFAIAKAA